MPTTSESNRSTWLIKVIPPASYVLVMLAGIIDLIGRQLDIVTPKAFLPGSVVMKANTAASFLLAGLALYLLQRPNAFRTLLARSCGAIIVLTGLLTLSQYFFGYNLGIDELLLREPTKIYATSHPGRMAPGTALNFVLIGFAFIYVALQRHRARFLFLFLLAASLSVSILGIVGYGTGLVELSGPSAYTQMALNTAALFVLLCVGLFLTVYGPRPEQIGIEEKLLVGLTAAASVIAFISFHSISSLSALVQASNWVEQSHEINKEVAEIFTNVVEGQSAERGFLLSGSGKYLTAFEKASRELPILLNDLGIRTSDNPRQQERLALLARAVEAHVAGAGPLVQAPKLEREQRGPLLSATVKEMNLEDSIRVLATQMLDAENELLKTKNADEAHQANRAKLVIYFSLGVQGFLLVFIFIVFNRDFVGRKRAEERLAKTNEELELRVRERDTLVTELQEALANIKTLHGLIPICANCKKIRDDRGYWNAVEGYIMQHTDATFSHGICPTCFKQLYPEAAKRMHVD
jgi:CHASE3 domain sensor protein